MANDRNDGNPYLLLTPGPLSTSLTVRQAMLRDWCTWDKDYNEGIVQVIRKSLIEIATTTPSDGAVYTAVLMQGSGTFSVESVLGTTIPSDGKLLILANGAYGRRMARIASVLGIAHELLDFGETAAPNLDLIDQTLQRSDSFTHVAMVHGETTTGMLNPLSEVGQLVRKHRRQFIVDAMSTFGGVPIDAAEVGIDYLVSSANKCIQGVPGFGFIVCKRSRLESCAGQARSLSLDLYDQWTTMEQGGGKWRFTSPTHTVRAFAQALVELALEGGVSARYQRYTENHRRLVTGMESLGFRCLLTNSHQSPIITAFHRPAAGDYDFEQFYARLKTAGFVIYPGKVTDIDTFRIGTIGEVYPPDIDRLLLAVRDAMYWQARTG